MREKQDKLISDGHNLVKKKKKNKDKLNRVNNIILLIEPCTQFQLCKTSLVITSVSHTLHYE